MSDFDAFLDTIDREDDDAWERIFSSIPLLQDMDILLQTSRMYIVAIGECGMDFHYIDGTDIGKIPFDRTCISERARRQIEHQKFWWLAQWKLAKKYHLPVVIHTRDAREETVTYMKRYGIDHAVMHCYAENPDMAQALMDFSPRIYFSFSGILTYKNARSVQETAKMLPLSRILLETDAPFLAPQPVRGTLCEPAFTRYTLDGLCALRDEDPSVIESCVYENSLRFFGMAS